MQRWLFNITVGGFLPMLCSCDDTATVQETEAPVVVERTETQCQQPTLRPLVVWHDLRPIRQCYSNGCWAAAIAMLYNWKHGTKMDELAAIKAISPAHWDQLRFNRKLDSSSKQSLLEGARLQYRYGQSYMSEALVELVRDHGPLWFTVNDDRFNTHANVVFGLSGGESWETLWVHSVDPTTGQCVEERFVDFHRRYEDAAFNADIFVAHFDGKAD